MERLTVGVIGCGVVGKVLVNWFSENTSHFVKVYDPPIGKKDPMTDCEFIFISVPVPTRNDYSQDTSILEDCLELCPKKSVKFIRSTVLPGTSDRLRCISMPEFLTERTAQEDFNKSAIIVGFEFPKPFMKQLFPGKQITYMKNKEAEMVKYTHNGFGALKVNYFNHIYKLCKEHNLDYNTVKQSAMLTGFITPTHTMVPGPDGLFGYGGKCLPKDLDAFYGFSKIELFRQTSEDNKKFRETTL